MGHCVESVRDIFNYTDFLQKLFSRREELTLEIANLEEQLKNYPDLIDLKPYDVYRMDVYVQSALFRIYADKYIQVRSDIDCAKATLDLIKRYIAKQMYIVHTESATGLVADGPLVVVEKVENVSDGVGSTPDVTTVGYGANDKTYFGSSLEISNFFERPVPLLTTQIPLGSSYQTVINVWNLWSMNPSVRAKLRNYAFLKCNLHVRFAMSGTPFDSGRLAISYVPLKSYQVIANAYDIFYIADSGVISPTLTYLSQTKGFKTMNPNENQPLDMQLPMIMPAPMTKLFNLASSALSDSTGFSDLADLGLIRIHTMTNFHNSGSSPVAPYLYIYAWATDVELGCTTGSIGVITTESKDEREAGPVENVASRIATYLSDVSSVPWLQPYAIPSSMIARGVSRFAALFGWSVPTMETEPMRMKNEPFQNMAHTIGYDLGHKITLDPKQELTVDHMASGGDGTDELAIATIASKISYLSTFTWSTTAAPFSPLYQLPVQPCLVNYYTNGLGNQLYQPTALAFSCLPFYWWRGSIVIRLEIVCDKFARGKLAVIYEPNVCQQTLINAGSEINKEYIQIIDLQETQEVDYCIEWAHERAWARCVRSYSSSIAVPNATLTYNHQEFCNGYVRVVPFTELQTIDGSSVSINVYVYGKDMKYNEYSMYGVPSYNYVPSTSLLDDVKTESSSSQEVTCVELNPVTGDVERISQDYFGEMPLSFRALLKRFQEFITVGVSNITNSSYSTRCMQVNMPLYPQDNFVNIYNEYPLMHYLKRAFLGIRGGVRFRLFYDGNQSAIGGATRVNLLEQSSANFSPSASVAPSFSNNSPGAHGTAEFIPSTNGGIEFGVPFYSNLKFAQAQQDDPWYASVWTGNNSFTRGFVAYHNYFTNVWQSSNGWQFSATNARVEGASAEDFDLVYWVAAPPWQTE